MLKVKFIIFSIILFEFNYSAQTLNEWTKEMVLWQCKSDPKIKLMYRVNIGEGGYNSLLEISGPNTIGNSEITGVLKVEQNRNPDSYSENNVKTEVIKVNKNYFLKSYAFNFSNVKQISFDGSCNSSHKNNNLKSDTAKSYVFPRSKEKLSANTNTLVTNKSKCDKILEYRDKDLYNEYSKVFDSYSIFAGIKNEIEEHKQTVLSDNSWNVSDARLVLGIVAKNIEATCGLISNLIGFHPAVGEISKKTETAISVSETVLKAIIANPDNFEEVVKEIGPEIAKNTIIAFTGPLAQATKTASDLAKNAREMTELPKDQIAYKAEIKRVLDLIDNEILKCEIRMKSYSKKIDDYNKIKEGIDLYINKNCK